MNNDNSRLTDKSKMILYTIATEDRFENVLQEHSVNREDIQAAAAEVLGLDYKVDTRFRQHIAEVRSQHPKAFSLWYPEEEAKLEALHRQGYDVKAISRQLQRKPSAIDSRLRRRGLMPRYNSVPVRPSTQPVSLLGDPEPE